MFGLLTAFISVCVIHGVRGRSSGALRGGLRDDRGAAAHDSDGPGQQGESLTFAVA